MVRDLWSFDYSLFKMRISGWFPSQLLLPLSYVKLSTCFFPGNIFVWIAWYDYGTSCRGLHPACLCLYTSPYATKHAHRDFQSYYRAPSAFLLFYTWSTRSSSPSTPYHTPSKQISADNYQVTRSRRSGWRPTKAPFPRMYVGSGSPERSCTCSNHTHNNHGTTFGLDHWLVGSFQWTIW